jgi:hypothetical protein
MGKKTTGDIGGAIKAISWWKAQTFAPNLKFNRRRKERLKPSIAHHVHSRKFHKTLKQGE